MLAAGRGARIGGPKALLQIGGRSFLLHVADALRRAGIAHVVAVVGHERARVTAEGARDPELRIVYNPRHAEGMLTSVWSGLEAAEEVGATAVLLHPVDHPLVEPETVERVLAALAAGAAIAVPSHEGRRGHPGGFARRTWDALRAVSPALGARGVLQAHPDWIVHVPGDAGCRAGIDTPLDYRELIEPRRE